MVKALDPNTDHGELAVLWLERAAAAWRWRSVRHPFRLLAGLLAARLAEGHAGLAHLQYARARELRDVTRVAEWRQQDLERIAAETAEGRRMHELIRESAKDTAVAAARAGADRQHEHQQQLWKDLEVDAARTVNESRQDRKGKDGGSKP
jgi:hypothetical protein